MGNWRLIIVMYSLGLITVLIILHIIDKVIEIGGCYDMETNVEERKVMRISRQPFPVKIMIDQNQPENVEALHLGKSRSLIRSINSSCVISWNSLH